MNPGTESVLWWTVIAAVGVDVLLVGWLLVHLITNADTLCPRAIRDLPAHARAAAETAVAAARLTAVQLAVGLLLLATPHTPENAR